MRQKVITSNRIIIQDFVDGIDKLELSEGLTFADLTIINNGTNTATLVKEASTNEILAVLSGIDSTVIDVDSFISG